MTNTQKQPLSQYSDVRPIPAVQSRISALDKRYGRLCRYFRKNPGAGPEKRFQFAALATEICGELNSLNSELSTIRATLAKMKEKHADFSKYLESDSKARSSLRSFFLEKYGRAPEECFHEFHVLAEEIARIEGAKPALEEIKAGIRNFFGKMLE